MPARTASPEPSGPRHRNEVLLRGLVATAPQERVLADGHRVVVFRLAVDRDPYAGGGGGQDSVECSGGTPRVRRAAARWRPGDAVEVAGALRRRFYRAGAASRPFTLVEVERARRLGRG